MADIVDRMVCTERRWATSRRPVVQWRSGPSDVLTLTAGSVSEVWVVSDELGLLVDLDAVQLA